MLVLLIQAIVVNNGGFEVITADAAAAVSLEGRLIVALMKCLEEKLRARLELKIISPNNRL